MTADAAIKLVLMILRIVYKQALAHHGGQPTETSAGVDEAIKKLESVLAVSKDVESINLSFLDV